MSAGEREIGDDPPRDEGFAGRFERLPKEVGALLITIGIAEFPLPSPVGSSFVLAGGLVRSPSGSNRVEGWFKWKSPGQHRDGMNQIHRFPKGPKGRHPGTFRREPPSEAAVGFELGADQWPSMSS